MSVANRPNLNAVGLMVDITDAVAKRIRGKAGEAGIQKVFPLITNQITRFVEEIDETLDREFGR